jgi:hypothetical protein
MGIEAETGQFVTQQTQLFSPLNPISDFYGRRGSISLMRSDETGIFVGKNHGTNDALSR